MLLLLVAVTACNNNNKSTGNASDDAQLSFITQEYKLKSELVNGVETTLTADIPVAEGDSTITKNINAVIFKTTKSIVGQEGDTSNNYNELFSGFIRNYDKFVAETPDYIIGWEATIKGTVEYETQEIINIRLDSYIITGGAHGNSNMTSLFFDPKSGKELSIQDIVKDTMALTNIAEKKFREKFDIPADKSINSTGLMFVDDKFTLPQNIFVTKDGLLLYYNPYEIAAYAEGAKELLIQYSDIEAK